MPRCIHNVYQHTGPLNMAQKVQSETGPFGCAFDQSGNIRHDKVFARSDPDYAQIGLQGREMIIGDLRFGIGQNRQSVDLPTFGNPTRPTSAIIFSSRTMLFFALAPGLGKTGRPPGRTGKFHIAAPATAAFGDRIGFARRVHILDHGIGFAVLDQSAYGDFQIEIVPFFPYCFLFRPFSPRSAL